jgi:hypothetical protein
MSDVDVRRFVSGALSNANIDDAIDAAIAWAVANTGTDLTGPGYMVTVPAGKWTLARPHVFPAFGTYRCAIGLQGAGMNLTVFSVVSDAEASPVFTFGTASFPSPSSIGFTLYLRVFGFSINAANEGSCKRTGIRMYGAVNPLIQGVSVRGLYAADSTEDQGRGIEILPVTVDGVRLNSQFVDMRNCDVYGCMTGLYVRLSYPCTFDNVHAQGCMFENAIIQGSTVTWINSGIQFGSIGVFPDRWYGNRNMPGVVSGFDSTAGLINATSVTCGAQSGGLCVVSGGTLAGLDAREDKARWVRLTPTGSTANELKVKGVYKIRRILSDTSMEIVKGSNHTSQGGLSAQLCQADNQVTLTLTNVYNESLNNRATVGAWRDDTGGSEYVIEKAEFQGGEFILEADRVKSVTIRNIRQSNTTVKAAKLEYVESSDIEADISKIEADDYSYAGLRCLDNTSFPNALSVKGTWRSANGGTAARLRSALRELGAVEIWDVRVASSLSLTGADVNSITGVVNGTILLPSTTAPAGLKPTYTALDLGLDAPAIVGVTGAGAARSFMEGQILAANLPSYGYTTTLVLIGRVPDTAISFARRFQARTEGAFPNFVQHFIGLHDNQYRATGTYAYYRTYGNEYPNNEGSSVYSATTDTEPHVWVSSAMQTVADGAQALSWDRGEWIAGGPVSVRPFHFLGANMLVGIGAELGQVNSGSLIWTVAAVIPRSLAHAEHQRIVDLARVEFPLEP